MGLSPHSYLNGSKWTGQAREYCIPSSDGSAYAIGDPVTVAGSADANGVPTVALSTAGTGNAITGIIVGTRGTTYGGAMVDPGNLETTIIPATKTKAYYVMVADDPNIVFEAQEDSVGANLAVTDVMSNVNLVSGINNGYVSGWMVDSNPVATTATLQCQLLGLVQRADNALGQYAKWLVRINNHSFKAGTAGV
jgi:hypothetical protein